MARITSKDSLSRLWIWEKDSGSSAYNSGLRLGSAPCCLSYVIYSLSHVFGQSTFLLLPFPFRRPSWSPSSYVTWVTHVILLDDRLIWLSQILMIAAHSEEFASREKKYQTSLIFSSRPREANFSTKIRRTRDETAEFTVSRGILVSSFLHVCGGLSGQIRTQSNNLVRLRVPATTNFLNYFMACKRNRQKTVLGFLYIFLFIVEDFRNTRKNIVSQLVLDEVMKIHRGSKQHCKKTNHDMNVLAMFLEEIEELQFLLTGTSRN